MRSASIDDTSLWEASVFVSANIWINRSENVTRPDCPTDHPERLSILGTDPLVPLVLPSHEPEIGRPGNRCSWPSCQSDFEVFVSIGSSDPDSPFLVWMPLRFVDSILVRNLPTVSSGNFRGEIDVQDRVPRCKYIESHQFLNKLVQRDAQRTC